MFLKESFFIALTTLAACLQSGVSQKLLDISHNFSWNFKDFTISLNGTLTIVATSPDEGTTIDGPGRSIAFEKSYYCVMDTGSVTQEVLLNTSRGWTFPRQDTNLTLSYFSTQSKKFKEHVITSYRVNLFQDSSWSQGFVTSGGLLSDYVTLDLLSGEVSSLAYEFEVYGLIPDEITQEMVDSVHCS